MNTYNSVQMPASVSAETVEAESGRILDGNGSLIQELKSESQDESDLIGSSVLVEINSSCPFTDDSGEILASVSDHAYVRRCHNWCRCR